MHLRLSDAYTTRLRGLYRLAGSAPSSPLILSTYGDPNVWELDWPSKRLALRFGPQRPLVQRVLRRSAPAPDGEGVERPLHNVLALVSGQDGPLVIDGDARTGRTHLVDLCSGSRQLVARGSRAFSAACTIPVTAIALGGHRPITLLQWPGAGVLGEMAGHNDGARDMAFSPDGRLLASVGGESEDEQHRDAIRLWDVQTLAERRSWLWHHLGAVAFHPGGDTIAVGCMMPAAIKLWHLESDVVNTVAVDAPGGISCLCYSPDGRWLWAGDRTGKLMLFTVEM